MRARQNGVYVIEEGIFSKKGEVEFGLTLSLSHLASLSMSLEGRGFAYTLSFQGNAENIKITYYFSNI